MAQFHYQAATGDNEIKHLSQILSQCFIGSPSESLDYINQIGASNFRTIGINKQLVGGLALIPMGQWWGGQRVTMTGIAAVGIAPEYRGGGAAITLLQQMLRELHDTGVPISVLYPATQRLYRKAGYEQGGSRVSWSMPTSAIQLRDRLLPIQSVESIEINRFVELQQAFAQRQNGHLDRHVAIWQERLKTDDKTPLYAYLIGEPPQGYVIFTQRRSVEQSTLQVRDWAVTSAEAGRSLLTFWSDHRSQIDKIGWTGAAIDPLLLLLPEQSAKQVSSMSWMLRIVNARSALEKRGYPVELETELHVELQDDWLTENNGKFVLSVSEGKGDVSPGGRGDLKLTIRGLAPLYSGWLTPLQLKWTGLLDASDSVLTIATQLFTGSCPWLPDFF
ncbi:GNAT family N-acetyltransferase [Thermocoleostomius sinensis]|uniref:GNAT family N-acetyltransferase n=1 Tax=Thermocoleostomius sinensis A174 TaxID=2016057 RepID=A0A9E9C5B4_9CYAN|nr:GNAT family N-acetyltransferase [Thermocoleostomius sinensis]WAL60931.1 GNAT family N-acetyltransferase [Thermocoleostomius sinensis A174]